MELLRNFNKINKNDVLLAGGKGASLGEMIQANIPVPPGFVIFSSAFEQFIKETDLNIEIEAILDSVNHKEIHTVENASEKIKALILETEIPQNIVKEIQKNFKDLNAKYVAVRSSATAEDGKEHAWAGQLDSFLNTTEHDLLEKVRRCWASLFTPRAIFYRFEKGLQGTKISVAVVVQKMVNSEISGIAFSVHPVTEDRNQIIIEAGFGLGEAIVSGQITPDAYVVAKDPRKIIDINVNTQIKGLYRTENGGNQWQDIAEPKASSQVLDETQILELSGIIVGIENHYGFPCDIEWAYEAKKFYIVQSRPITTLTSDSNNTPTKEIVLADYLIDRLNGKKIIRLEGDIVPFLALIDWFNYYDADDNFLNLYPSISYFSKIRKAVYMDTAYSDCARYTLQQLLAGKMQLSEIEDYYKYFYKKIKEAYDKYFISGLLNQEDENNLLKLFKEFHDYLREFLARILFIEQMDEDVVRDCLKDYKVTDLDEIWDIVKTPYFVSFESRNNQAIIDALKNKRNLDYLSYVFINYTFIPDLEYVNNTIAKVDVDHMEIELKKVKENTKQAFDIYQANLKKLNKQDRKIADILSWVMYTRDERKDIINMAEMLLFRIGQRLFSLWGLDENLLRYTANYEILQGKNHVLSIHDDLKKRPNGFGILFKEDRSYRAAYGLLEEDIKKLDNLILAQNQGNDKQIKGEIGNKGKVSGRVHIISRRDQFDDFKKGDILVTGMTRPEFVPLMKKSLAIITDEGGITCHAAIVSRELGIPCIIGTKIATQVLKDGDLVEVDADHGIVRIISKQELESAKVKKDNKNQIINSSNTVIDEYEQSGIFEKKWTKIWTTEYSMFSVWLFSREYIENCKEELGFGFDDIIFLIEGDLATVYRDNKKQEEFVKFLAEKSLGDSKFRDRCLNKYFDLNDKLLQYIRLNEEEGIKYENLLDFINVHKKFIAYFLVPLWSPNGFSLVSATEDLKSTVFKEFEHARKSTEHIYPDIEKYINKLYLYIAKKENIVPTFLRAMLPEELLHYSKSGLLPSENILAERYNCSVLIAEKKKNNLVMGEDAKRIIKRISAVETNGVKEIFGVSACKGKVVGIVRKVFMEKDMNNFEAGAILVTTMTRPEWLPIMIKAGAFVTDAGGVLSHAAIASRELNKPCIIGTKIATQVLKDGDLVEVDANMGIVRIIKKVS